jgi:hypothetical protein
MSISVTWDSSFEGSPGGSDDPREGDNKIREVKAAISERMRREHYFTPGSDNDKHGLHLEGSARAWVDDEEPTESPEGVELGADDAGRMWFDSDAGFAPSVYDGSAWQGFLRSTARFSVSGILATGSNVCPRMAFTRACEVMKVTAFVETPPSGGTLVIDVEDSAGDSVFTDGSLSIADGDSTASITDIAAEGTLAAGDTLVLDIDSLTGTPADLSVVVEYKFL